MNSGISILSQDRSKDKAITPYPLQDFYLLPVQESLYVSSGDTVEEGQIICETMSKHLITHSPVTGTVTNIISHQHQDYIEIRRNHAAPAKEFLFSSPQGLSIEQIMERIRKSGITGLEDQQPVHLKIAQAQGRTRKIIINALDTEPFLTADYRLILEKTQELIQTAFQLKALLKSNEIIITITKNSALKKIIQQFIFDRQIQVIEIPKIYPLFNERLLIKHLFSIELKHDQPSIESGLLVLNVPTLYALYESLFYQKPVIERVITIDGAYSLEYGNFLVKIGTPIASFMRPFSAESSYAMFSGGPLTGQELDKEKSLTKSMKGVMIFEGHINQPEYACIFCAKCVHNCPIGLYPFKLIDYLNHKEFDFAKQHSIQECIRCNICSYVCPSFIPLGKQIIDYLNSEEQNNA